MVLVTLSSSESSTDYHGFQNDLTLFYFVLLFFTFFVNIPLYIGILVVGFLKYSVESLFSCELKSVSSIEHH